MTRKICFVTGTRAEFGLLRWLMQLVHDAQDMQLQVVVTGMHLSPEFGLTFREVEQAGFVIDERVEMLLSADTATGISKSMGLGMIGLADAYARLAPDLVLVLGDRFEMLAAASAAMVASIPIAHLHGGETTEGAFDEAIRHAISKMAHLHFVAAEPYRRRVIQLGEQPERVFLVGGLGLDALAKVALMPKAELEASMQFRFLAHNLLITFHPVTLDSGSSLRQMGALLDALGDLEDTGLIFTMPNADTGSRALADMVEQFVATHPNAASFVSLGQRRYLSCLQFVDGVVGNSSSGLAEAPSMRVGTVNIGERQKGRLAAQSVIHCAPDAAAIAAAIAQLYTPRFRAMLRTVTSPYGVPGASDRIAAVLRDYPLEGILKKTFYDLPA